MTQDTDSHKTGGEASADVPHGIREVTCCKDANGKVGIRLRAVDCLIKVLWERRRSQFRPPISFLVFFLFQLSEVDFE